MILISHRGNIEGKVPESENNPLYINKALQRGYDVEIDVWYNNGAFYLGHDNPQYEVSINYLRNDKMWCHAKNVEALNLMLKENIHCFWHQEDDVTLTSRGHMWTFPGKETTDKSICILLEKDSKIPEKVFGICSDYIKNYKNKVIK